MRALSVLCLATAALFAQSPPTFEVASVKPSSPDARGTTFNYAKGGGFIASNATLKGLVESAYEVRDFQIAGGPGWFDSARYDVTAKSLEPSTMNESRLKLRALLADRFHLQLHRETKEMPVLALSLAKSGSKLAAAPGAVDGPSGINAQCGQMTGTQATMATLAVVLSRDQSSPVLDRTGLTGKYNFKLAWSPDTPCHEAPEGLPADGPSLFTAIQEQLGLKLEPTRGPVEVVVIDSAEKAAGN